MINTTTLKPNTNTLHQLLLDSWEGINKQTLYWRKPNRLQDKYQLHSQDHILGTLQYEEDRFIQRATAKTTQGEWLFKYTRFSLPKVTITKKNSIIAQTIMETNWGWYGTLILPNNGNRFSWESIDETENEFQFSNPDGYPLVIFQPHFGFLKLEGKVKIDPNVWHNPHLPLLIMLGWFLVLLRLR